MGMKIHMISHVKVCSLTTYYILFSLYGKLSIEIYALQVMMGFHQWLAHLPSSWLVNQACSISQHLAQQRGSRMAQIYSHVESILGIVSSWGQPKHIKNRIWWYQGVFLAKEWNSFHLLGKKLDHIHLKELLKYECELYLKPPLIPPQCKIIVAYRTLNCRLLIEFGRWSTILISSNNLFFVWHKLRNSIASEITYYAGFPSSCIVVESDAQFVFECPLNPFPLVQPH